MHGSPYNPPPYQGPPQGPPGMQPANNKIAAGLCGIFLGSFGIHKFVLGYNTEGLIMLLVTVLIGIPTCGIGASIIGIIGLIEGIIYLTKSDEQFMYEYVYNKKPWF